MSEVWKKVGKVKDAHGLRGDLYVLVFSGDISWVKQIKQVRLQNSNQQNESKTFEVEKVQGFKDGLKIKLKEIVDRTAGEVFIGWDFLLPNEIFVSKKGDTIFLGEVLHFKVLDRQKPIGRVEGFSSNGPQDLLIVKSETGATYEIPFVEAFLQKVDWDAQTIFMDLPDGLLEIGDE